VLPLIWHDGCNSEFLHYPCYFLHKELWIVGAFTWIIDDMDDDVLEVLMVFRLIMCVLVSTPC
jgi:hypothetical protein